MKRIYLPILCLLITACESIFRPPARTFPVVAGGEVIRFENFPSDYISPRTVDVWLPEGYDSTQQYSVLYMHDGQMLFDSVVTWNGQEWGVDETLNKLISSGLVQKTIVVAIWNGGKSRHAEYFPEKPFKDLSISLREQLITEAQRSNGDPLFSKGVSSDAYLKFLVEDLKPYVDTTFSVHTDADHTYLMGSSMGGLISLYALCEYPEVFGGAACLSTHWPGSFDLEGEEIPQAFLRYLEENLPEPGNHTWYFDHGTKTLDAHYGRWQEEVDALFQRKGYSQGVDVLTERYVGAEHTEEAWNIRLGIPMRFMLSTTPMISSPRTRVKFMADLQPNHRYRIHDELEGRIKGSIDVHGERQKISSTIRMEMGQQMTFQEINQYGQTPFQIHLSSLQAEMSALGPVDTPPGLFNHTIFGHRDHFKNLYIDSIPGMDEEQEMVAMMQQQMARSNSRVQFPDHALGLGDHFQFSQEVPLENSKLENARLNISMDFAFVKEEEGFAYFTFEGPILVSADITFGKLTSKGSIEGTMVYDLIHDVVVSQKSAFYVEAEGKVNHEEFGFYNRVRTARTVELIQ